MLQFTASSQLLGCPLFSRSCRPLFAAAVVLTVLGASHRAQATADVTFGAGPRNIALAQADVANPAPVAAAFVNPAGAWKAGVRVAIGYNHGFSNLKLDGDKYPMRDVAGTQVQLQVGREVLDDVALGGAVHAYLPNRSLARIEFSPGVEPSFIRFETSNYRATGVAAMAVRWRFISLGIGLSLLARAEGAVDFTMGQDAQGVYADGQADIATPYDVALVAGVAFDLDRAQLAFRYREAQAFSMQMTTRVNVQVQGNPLNGVTQVSLSGSSGYVPASLDLAASWKLADAIGVMTSLQYVRWSEAPTPSINLSMDIDLGLSPGMREVRFVRPNYRDILSPRLALEWLPSGAAGPWAVRAGYAFNPSPVSQVRGYATPVDSTYHVVGIGAGYELPTLAGVYLRVDGAAQLLQLEKRSFNKQKILMPFSEYTASGSMILGALTFQGTWQ